MIGRIARPLAAALLIAGLVHIIAILLIPGNIPRHVYDAVAETTPVGRMTVIDPRHSPIAELDPAFAHAVCPVTPGSGPVHVTGTMPAAFWSIAVVSDTGRIVGALTREDDGTGAVDLIVGKIDNPAVVAAPSTTVVPLAANAGFVMVHAMVEHVGNRPAVEAKLKALDCTPLQHG